MKTHDPSNAEELRSPATQLEPPIAYIKAFVLEGKPGYAVHAATGEMIGWCETREIAFAAAVQNDLLPVSVH